MSATHRVLYTLELLDTIFRYLDRFDIASTCAVCTPWVELSRDHIWWEVDTPCQLFRLLAPISPCDWNVGDPEDEEPPGPSEPHVCV